MKQAPSIPISGERLTTDFYQQATATVAKALIGKAILHRVGAVWLGGWIVETEAYLHVRDPASHSARGLTASNRSMFQAPGTLYVYPIHAKHCLNAVTESAGQGAAVLIRAIEPVWGTERMQSHRGPVNMRRLTAGPAMLCQALDIDRRDDGRSLTHDPDLGIFEASEVPPRAVATTRRIGISKSAHRMLRFVDPQSPFLSRPYRKK
ncbi:DNA-3-methyladenine glycosylase [Roseiconus nitratireducens]|uniref:Putative 3-methyladenine DNA glycosylase n=1 Tax=Roseiconus nitratireducens TaxID=2605748 RepID=A0A5M6DL31_9BACT|nr:DNA-3-methyladenine glycosylase [Roseiconus nitratireducens]KAA5546962.1 DNA-3-methyladenine glycosylase [Roseiconus nitratireducens]